MPVEKNDRFRRRFPRKSFPVAEYNDMVNKAAEDGNLGRPLDAIPNDGLSPAMREYLEEIVDILTYIQTNAPGLFPDTDKGTSNPAATPGLLDFNSTELVWQVLKHLAPGDNIRMNQVNDRLYIHGEPGGTVITPPTPSHPFQIVRGAGLNFTLVDGYLNSTLPDNIGDTFVATASATNYVWLEVVLGGTKPSGWSLDTGYEITDLDIVVNTNSTYYTNETGTDYVDTTGKAIFLIGTVTADGSAITAENNVITNNGQYLFRPTNGHYFLEAV